LQKNYNRLFYFAIPPNVFAETALAIKQTCMQDEGKGWTRLIVEKPFGRDLESFEELNETLSQHFTENHLYRIDHYLGKEMVQNLTVLRFSNIWFEKVWNRDNIETVILTFKEPFGTDGRGGYFDKYGIIRDILQNHLLQVLTLMTMEPPVTVEGPRSGKAIRDAKVSILNAMPPIELEDCVLGQYEGYADDPTIDNKDTNTPTFAVIRLRINNPRWHGVPIILKAGKALNERKAEMRIQFKDAKAATYLFAGHDCPRNELGTYF
jgi:glucose-6-phosphate 1-dehydrogenase